MESRLNIPAPLLAFERRWDAVRQAQLENGLPVEAFEGVMVGKSAVTLILRRDMHINLMRRDVLC